MDAESLRLQGSSSELKPSEKVEEKLKTKTESTWTQNEAVLTGIPIFGIALAELLLYSGKSEAAIWLHIGMMIALSLTTVFVNKQEINRIHQALMLLPILRLVNLSMSVFFENTFYTFIFIYAPLVIPLTIAATHQKLTREQLGLTLNKKLWFYLPFAIPMGFLLGLGKYSIIRTGYLIPDLAPLNVLELTLVMVFFVGLIEELIFRAILQTRLEETFGPELGLLSASLVFGLMHQGCGGEPLEILYAIFVGLFIGHIFQKTRSLPFVTLVHGLTNVFLFGIFPHILGMGKI